jgi:heme oxygenase
MRAGSRDEHKAAEQSPFIAELLGGRLIKDAYVDYLLRLRVVYAALESAVSAHRDDPLVAAVYDPALERLPALEADLRQWTNGDLRDIDSSASEEYRSRLESVRGGPLLAHHYTRYLGDLSGGQVICRALDRVYNLGGVGLAFYDFPIHAKRYKDSYRARLDDLTLRTEEVEQVVTEVKLAFRLNQALLDELSSHLAAYRA